MSASHSRSLRERMAGLGCAVAAGAVFLSACEPGGGPERKAFVETLGDDTMAVEEYVRGPDRFEGDVVVRQPLTQLGHYAAQLAEDGTIERLEVAWRVPEENPGGGPPLSVTYTMGTDSATIEIVRGDTSQTRVAVPPGVIPIIGSPPWSYAVFEQATMQAVDAAADSVPIHFLTPRGRIVASVARVVAADTITVDYFGYPVIAVVDEEGHVVSRSGRETTMKTEGVQATDLDIAAMAAEFATRDAAGEGMGLASPRDTVQAAVDEAALQVVYGRPAMRGREIWGELVPYGQVWRTGANAATHFTTDQDLEFDGTTVPAGTYTLYSYFTADSAKLIINEQTGQWGTVYNPGQDLVRLDLRSESLEDPVERFTIGVEDAEDGGVLELLWDRTRYFIPFRVR